VLSARVILTLQDRLCQLEERLEELDQKYSRIEAKDVNNGSIRDELPDRALLIEEIYEKLAKYS